MLTEDHKWQRVESACEFLRRYAHEKDNFLDSIVTGNKTWAYHYTPEMEQQSCQWQHSCSPKPQKFKQTQSTSKVMTTVFWDQKGVLLVDFMATVSTINADRYCDTLTKLRWAIQNRSEQRCKHSPRQRSTQRCPPNCHSLSMVWMGHYHPPTLYRNLAHSNFHLFPKLKEHLSGMRFNNDDEVKDAVQRLLNSMAGNWYDMGIRKLPIRLQKCIDQNGDYIET